MLVTNDVLLLSGLVLNYPLLFCMDEQVCLHPTTITANHSTLSVVNIPQCTVGVVSAVINTAFLQEKLDLLPHVDN